VDFRKYFRFVHRDFVYQFKSLPFGLTDSPYVFTRVIKTVLKVAQSNGSQFGDYLNDWLNGGFNPSTVNFNHKWLELLCLILRLLVNNEKSGTNTDPETRVRERSLGSGKRKDVSYAETHRRAHHISSSDVGILWPSTSHALAENTGQNVIHGE
jgi:hypothetical protein